MKEGGALGPGGRFGEGWHWRKRRGREGALNKQGVKAADKLSLQEAHMLQHRGGQCNHSWHRWRWGAHDKQGMRELQSTQSDT